jgi:hypothetical protein
MAATLAVAQGEGARTFESQELTPEQFRRVPRIGKAAGKVKPGDVRYTGGREIRDAAGVRFVHVFLTVHVIERRSGQVFFDGESTGYRAGAEIPCVGKR